MNQVCNQDEYLLSSLALLTPGGDSDSMRDFSGDGDKSGALLRESFSFFDSLCSDPGELED